MDDYQRLAERLTARGIEIGDIVRLAREFASALPSWAVGTGGTRFARFPGVGEPRDVFEKLEDCAVVQRLCRITPTVSLHIPWDEPKDLNALRQHAAALGLGFDAMNSNTFQDQPGQEHSYKFGSLTHTDKAVRAQAITHNLHCVRLGQALGSRAITVWIGDGGNFPGQIHFRRAFDRYVESLRAIHAGLPADWKMFLEHKLYEPAFYSTVNNDWGASLLAATATGAKALCLVDLGHHAPNVNIEGIVAHLARQGRLGGFHFNDSKYGDDDLDAGSQKPFQLFLVFCELVAAAREQVPGFAPCYMLDQAHNVTDPIESLLTSAIEVQRAYVKALLVDWGQLEECQQRNDALLAHQTLKSAFWRDVEPILVSARLAAGGEPDPLLAYRKSGYRASKARERAPLAGSRSGIV